MTRDRCTYHHGDLRAALIGAADAIVAETGIEGFSLRAAATRAGVSPGAPAHHFGSARGLLTEVALLAFKRLGRALEAVGPSEDAAGDAAADVRALGLAFVRFVLENPGHFRLMFRNDLVNRDDPRYPEASLLPARRLGGAIAAYHEQSGRGQAGADTGRFEDAVDLFGALATLHGLAHMVLAGKAGHFFPSASDEEFVERDLPRVLARLYPGRE